MKCRGRFSDKNYDLRCRWILSDKKFFGRKDGRTGGNKKIPDLSLESPGINTK